MAVKPPRSIPWRTPATITAFFPLAQDQIEPVKTLLDQGLDPWHLEALANLHFFRMLVLEPSKDLMGRPLPGRLVLSVVFDGSFEEIMCNWLQLAGDPLLQLLSHCEDFTGDQPEEALTYLLKHATKPFTYHIGALRTHAAQVREESKLYSAIQSYIDERQNTPAWPAGDPSAIRLQIQEFVASQPDLPQSKRPRTPLFTRMRQSLAGFVALAMVMLPPATLALLCPWARGSVIGFLVTTIAILLSLVLVWALIVRCYEIGEPDLVVTPKAGKTTALLNDEDKIIQNQFTMLTPVRNSRFRRLNLRLTLWLSNQLSRHWWDKGQLVGIDTIHFARFHLLDGGRRMLFMSDFDGGWDRYLFDFLGVGALAVVPNWSNLHGCPKVRFLRFPTLGFSQRFLPFTRANQCHTQLWYSRRAHLSLNDIKRNAEIRAGLFGTANHNQAQNWLALF